MPRRDGTGPMGQGEMTGRGLGTCTDNNANVNTNANMDTARMGYRQGCGQGRGQGRGRGARDNCRRGYRNYNVAPSNEMTDKDSLAKEIKVLQNKLDLLNQQIKDQPEVTK
jgi:hypothetical protein